MKKYNLIFLIIISFAFCNSYEKQNIKSNPLLSYLESNYEKPNDYVIRKFKDHDVIFIGEYHYIKEQVDFVKNLIPDLYKNGIYNLGTEFIRYSDTELN